MMAITGVCPFDPSVPGVRVRKREEREEGVSNRRGRGEEGERKGRV
jgi:hypothetical protein